MEGTTEVVGSLMILFVIVIVSRRLIKRKAKPGAESDSETDTNHHDHQE